MSSKFLKLHLPLTYGDVNNTVIRLSFHDSQRLGWLGIIRVRVRRPFKYFLYCGLGILGDRIVFVVRDMNL